MSRGNIRPLWSDIPNVRFVPLRVVHHPGQNIIILMVALHNKFFADPAVLKCETVATLMRIRTVSRANQNSTSSYRRWAQNRHFSELKKINYSFKVDYPYGDGDK